MISNLNNLLIQFEATSSQFEKLNPEVSKSNVGWHIEHSLLTLNAVIDALPKSDPKEYKWKFNYIRTIILTIKKIPRGKGKAPKVVQPQGDYTYDSLSKHIAISKEKIKQLQSINKDQFFLHPYFGKIKLKQTINFLEIHTKHHLDIINDIIK